MVVTIIAGEVETFFGEHGEEEDKAEDVTVSTYRRHVFISQFDEKPSGERFEAIVQLKRKQAERLRDLLTDWLKQ